MIFCIEAKGGLKVEDWPKFRLQKRNHLTDKKKGVERKKNELREKKKRLLVKNEILKFFFPYSKGNTRAKCKHIIFVPFGF